MWLENVKDIPQMDGEFYGDESHARIHLKNTSSLNQVNLGGSHPWT